MQKIIISGKATLCLAIMVSFLSAGMNAISEHLAPWNMGFVVMEGEEDDGRGNFYSLKARQNTRWRDAVDIKKRLSVSHALDDIDRVILVYLCTRCDRPPPSFPWFNPLTATHIP